MSEQLRPTTTVARHYLALLWQRGIESLFVNAGTDFAPLVEAYATNKAEGGPELPHPVVCAHENLATGMAHGAYLVAGRPQAVMFHVGVGTANAICAVTNAARDNVPLLVTAGRTPILERGALGARDTNIHWAQEMFDQAGMLRELVKWDYELRDPRQVDQVVDRALTLATAPPAGPVYLALPRELLAAPMPHPAAADETGPGALPAAVTVTSVPAAPRPDPSAIATLADRLAEARFPVIVTSAAGADRAAVGLLSALCDRYSVGVVEPAPRYLNVAPDHPLHLGTQVGRALEAADVVVVLESDVPWMPTRSTPRPGAFVAQVGIDPLFTRYPMRTQRSDLTISAGPSAFLEALTEALVERETGIDPARQARLAEQAEATRGALDRERQREREAAPDAPITKAFLSMALGELLGDDLHADAVVFNEYWAAPELLGRTRPGTYFYLPPAGGLGWALPAALGARYADPQRTVVATVGDGAYLFANPAACHHAAAKHDLPVLAIVANNSTWGAVDYATQAVYPDGRAVAQGEHRLSDLSPSPAFEAYSQASGRFGERVTRRDQVRPALERALDAVERQGRQALLNVECV
jgi:acetolactate synthase-1/2/3 large subunit